MVRNFARIALRLRQTVTQTSSRCHSAGFKLAAPYDAETAFLGGAQVAWLQRALAESRAVWKVISADMPIGLKLRDDYVNNPPRRWEAVANGYDGPAAGRELEIARVLSFIKQHPIANSVWLTCPMPPPPGKANLSPYAELQFFGEVNIAPRQVVTTSGRYSAAYRR